MTELMNICRICLKENQNIEEMQPLFEGNPRCLEIVQQIEECGGIVLKPHDDFPKMICQQCLQCLDTSYKFRSMCQASEHALLDVIIKSELHLDIVEGDSETPTHSEYIELRGEYIDAEEIDMVVDDQIGGDEEEFQCESYSPMPTDNEEEGDLLTADSQIEEELEGEAEEDVELYEDNKDVVHRKLLKSKVDQEDLLQQMQTQKKTILNSGVKRKRGRPRLCALPYGVIKHENETDSEVKLSTDPIKSNSRGRKKNEDVPSSIMCEICGNIYSKPALMHVHRRRHIQEKPFECEICNKRFSGNSEVRRHMRVHTGEKPYVCRFCGRTFADRSTNIKHERVHTNERPFTCKQCGKSFTYSNVLKNHMLIHTGEKPFPCLPCNKTFSRKHQLEQHCLTLTHRNTVKNLDQNIQDINDSSDERLLKVC